MTPSSSWAWARSALPSSATPTTTAIPRLRIVAVSEPQPDTQLALVWELRRGRDQEVRRLPVAGRRDLVQAIEHVEHVEEEVEAVEPSAERQLVTHRQVDQEG